jgi:TonB family protein
VLRRPAASADPSAPVAAGGRLRGLVVAALLAGSGPIAHAQHLLVVKDGDKAAVVVAAQDTRPQVLENGKLRTATADRYALVERGEYLPLYVAVRHPEVKTTSLIVDGGAGEINREFHFSCELETAYSLSNVFLVLAMKNDRGENSLFLFGVGRLEPRTPDPIDLVVPMLMDNAPGRYQLYLFSGGRELFQSRMPIGAMENALNRMVAARVRGLQDAPPQPFVGPEPEYPRALRKKKVSGSATLAFTVDARGRIFDATVVAATHPEFGEAALAAIREWRFLPQVKGGRPVSTKAEMPFNFAPPVKP